MSSAERGGRATARVDSQLYEDHPAHPAYEERAHQSRGVIRRLKHIVLGLGVLVILVCVGMVVTSAIDDVQIARDRATATADIIGVSTTRTSVRFRDDEGNYHQPNTGLKYPTGLSTGERVRVEYQASNPENVKVAGRSWTLAFLPALSSMFVGLLVVLALGILVEWLERRLGRAEAGAPGLLGSWERLLAKQNRG